jgi:hypothetical protein
MNSRRLIASLAPEAKKKQDIVPIQSGKLEGVACRQPMSAFGQ